MALEVGSIVIADNGTHSGSGLSFALFEASMSICPANVKTKQIKKAVALFNTALAGAIVGYFVANAEITVTVPTGAGGAGLQRLPATLAEDEPTKAPAAAKTLSGTLT